MRDALQLACLTYGTSDPYSHGDAAQVLCYSTPYMNDLDYEAWLARFAQRPGAEPEPEPGTEIEPEPNPSSPEEELFNGSTWWLNFGQSMGYQYQAVFYPDGTFTAICQAPPMEHGTYTYRNGTLILNFSACGEGCVFRRDGTGFVSEESYPMQGGEDHYSMTPWQFDQDDYLMVYQLNPYCIAHILDTYGSGDWIRVEVLRSVSYEESYIDSLQVGDWVDEGDWTAQVIEISSWNGTPTYILDDYCSIVWNPTWKLWILCAPSDAPILQPITPNAYQYDYQFDFLLAPDLLVRDEMYAVETGTAPQLWSMQQIAARYGADLPIYTFYFTMTDGIVTEATLVYRP